MVGVRAVAVPLDGTAVVGAPGGEVGNKSSGAVGVRVEVAEGVVLGVGVAVGVKVGVDVKVGVGVGVAVGTGVTVGSEVGVAGAIVIGVGEAAAVGSGVGGGGANGAQAANISAARPGRSQRNGTIQIWTALLSLDIAARVSRASANRRPLPGREYSTSSNIYGVDLLNALSCLTPVRM